MRQIVFALTIFAAGSTGAVAEVVMLPIPKQSLKAHETIDRKADCPSGKQAVAGGYEIRTDKVGLSVSSNHPWSPNTTSGNWTAWRVVFINRSDAPVTADVDIFAVCQ